MTHVIDNPLDDFSNSDDQTNHIATPTGFTPPPPFYTKRPNKVYKKTRFKVLPKRKHNLHFETNREISSLHSSTVQNPTIPNYSTVNTTPIDNSLDNTSANNNNNNDSPAKVYSKKKLSFLCTIFLYSIHYTFSLQYSTLGCHLQKSKHLH